MVSEERRKQERGLITSMRDYMSKKYSMPQDIYMRTLWLIRGYDRLKARYDDLADLLGAAMDGQPRGGGVADTTALQAVERARLFEECQAIEQAYLCIPEEYRRGIWENVTKRVPYPDTAHYQTWAKHRREFIRRPAENMHYI